MKLAFDWEGDVVIAPEEEDSMINMLKQREVLMDNLSQIDADIHSLQAASSTPEIAQLIAGKQVERARISTEILSLKPLTTQLN